MKYLKKFEELQTNTKFKKDKNGHKYKDGILTDEKNRGSIRYRIYDDNMLEFMGSRTDVKYRGQGVFSDLLAQMLNTFKGYKIYVPLSNPTLVPMFLRLGFEVTEDKLRYWGKPENSVNVTIQN